MDPKFLYWTAALVNMVAMVGFVVTGVRRVRGGNVAGHRRAMTIAATLVVGFVLSYVLKVMLLGREDFGLWTPAAVWTLRVHETCVAVMILGGAAAFVQARRMRGSRNVTRAAADPMAKPSVPRWHRRAGWSAVAASVLGLVTAFFVWIGMWARAV